MVLAGILSPPSARRPRVQARRGMMPPDLDDPIMGKQNEPDSSIVLDGITENPTKARKYRQEDYEYCYGGFLRSWGTTSVSCFMKPRKSFAYQSFQSLATEAKVSRLSVFSFGMLA